MKYIKALNIDFNNWEEIDINNKYLNDVFDELNIGDRILIDFVRYGIITQQMKNKWGIIKFKKDNVICIEFDDDIKGHDGIDKGCKGKDGHCWYFYKDNPRYNSSKHKAYIKNHEIY